jgi:hypothetical protein
MVSIPDGVTTTCSAFQHAQVPANAPIPYGELYLPIAVATP